MMPGLLQKGVSLESLEERKLFCCLRFLYLEGVLFPMIEYANLRYKLNQKHHRTTYKCLFETSNLFMYPRCSMYGNNGTFIYLYI